MVSNDDTQESRKRETTSPALEHTTIPLRQPSHPWWDPAGILLRVRRDFMKSAVSISVNGRQYQEDVEPRLLLVHFLRNAGLTGTKIGCDTSQCGSCTVLMDGIAVKSCTTLAVQADGASITTIEGLAENGELTPIQDAFWSKHGLQCGFCTPGMVFAAHEILRNNPNPSAEQIRHGLEGNMCRCTGYQNIVRAVQAAAADPRRAGIGGGR
jgi:aerobic carbon-monoxide dehydrogenase small subunit